MKKVLALCLALVLVIVAVTGATLAYFTDTAAQKNTFTVGKVDIKLDEQDVNDPTKRTEENQEFEDAIVPGRVFTKDPTITLLEGSEESYVMLKLNMNKYVSLINLMGVEYYAEKDDNYPGFINFMRQIMADSALREDFVNRWFGGIDHSKWEILNAEEIADLVTSVGYQANDVEIGLVLGYKDTLNAGESVTFMETFGMPATVTQSMMNGEDAYYINGESKSNFNTVAADFRMHFTAYAIQAYGFDNVAEAWAAYDGE